MMRRMIHWSAQGVSALALSGCLITTYKDFKEPTPPTCVAYSGAMKVATDWSHYMPDLYPGLKGCIASHPAGTAMVVDVQMLKAGDIKVIMQGSNGAIYTCVTNPKSPKPQSVTPGPDDIKSKGPAFRPSTWDKPPPERCIVHERVDSCSGLPLGWLTYFRC